MALTIACPHCRGKMQVATPALTELACPHCRQTFRMAPAPPPLTPARLITIDVGPRLKTRISPAKVVSRVMLFFTVAWVVCLGATFFWCAFRAVTDRQLPPDQAGITIFAGSVCLWFFETLAYGAVMLVLWVVRENLKDG